MFKNTPLETAAAAIKANAEKFNAAAAQEAVKPMMDNLKAWSELAQKQAQAAQAAAAESVEAFKNIKDPQAAFEAMKASAEHAMAMAAKNVKDATALSVSQFHASVDTLEKSSPSPEVFAGVAKGLRDAASSVENAVDTALKTGAGVAARAATAKKPKSS